LIDQLCCPHTILHVKIPQTFWQDDIRPSFHYDSTILILAVVSVCVCGVQNHLIVWQLSDVDDDDDDDDLAASFIFVENADDDSTLMTLDENFSPT